MESEDQDLESRLEAARVRQRSATAAREENRKNRELLEAVEAAERSAKDEEAIAAAEAEHGPTGRALRVIRTSFGCVILKRPSPIHYKRFRDVGKANTTAFEKLVRPCVIYPDASALDRILEEEPATLDRCANAVVELAGFRAEELSEKS